MNVACVRNVDVRAKGAVNFTGSARTSVNTFTDSLKKLSRVCTSSAVVVSSLLFSLSFGLIKAEVSGRPKHLYSIYQKMIARGRDFSAAHIVPFGVLPDAGKLDYYASIGCTEVVLRVPSAPRDEVMPVLDEFVCFADKWNK